MSGTLQKLAENTAKKATLFRPDTAYLFAHVHWKPQIAVKINEKLAEMATPSARNLLARIDEFCGEQDPFEAERLRNLPWPELMQELKQHENTDNPLQVEGDEDQAEVMPAATVTIHGQDFAFQAWSPRRGCNFQLQRDGLVIHGRISNPHPRQPNFYLEIGSSPFWLCEDWQGFLKTWEKWLKACSSAPTEFHISRIDLAFHTQALAAEDINRDRFSCRAQMGRRYSKAQFLEKLERAYGRDEELRRDGRPEQAVYVKKYIEETNKESGVCEVDFFRGFTPQMITYGTRSRIYARIYNKSAEISRNPVKLALFQEIYKKAGFDLSRDVVNVEFEIGRSWLMGREFQSDHRSFVIDTLSDLIHHHEKLIGYLLGTENQKGWLRMIEKTHSRNENCETSKAWELIRTATALLPEVSAHERQRARSRGSLQRLVPQLARCKARMDAFLGRSSPSTDDYSVKQWLLDIGELWEAEQKNRESSLSLYAVLKIYESERARSQPPEFAFETQPQAMPA